MAGRMKPSTKRILVGVVIAFGILAVAVLVWPALQSFQQWYLTPPSKGGFSVTNRKDLVLGYAYIGQAIALLLAGVVGAIGLLFTSRTLNQTREHTNRQLRQAEEGQVTERFTKAIDQLGSDKLEIRIGGIYALERIAVDSLETDNNPGRDYATIMQVLTAYVRENAPWPPKTSKEEHLFASDTKSNGDTGGNEEAEQTATLHRRKPPADIQAIADVLRRRKIESVPAEYHAPLNLRETDLLGAALRAAHLQEADLASANLQGANLRVANLVGANLQESDLRGADLVNAKLQESDLRGADLRGANLGLANLRGADLRRADLYKVKHLTQGQLEQARGDETTNLSKGYKLPESWTAEEDEQAVGKE